MDDIAFIDANINDYQDIPASLYPVLPGVPLSNVTVNRTTSPVLNGVLPVGDNVFIKWTYPAPDDLLIRVAVGYQLQIIEGTFSASQSQSISPLGPLVYQSISNFKTAVNPIDRFINLQFGSGGQADIPDGILRSGVRYTVRIRALVFSELGSGTVGSQYFKYSEWGHANFSVNTAPNAINLRVNGLVDPTALPKADGVKFSFTFNDIDGPAFLYRIQIGTTPGMSFAANVWDSGLISGGKGFGRKDISVPFAGTLSSGVSYAWRVNVNDGLVDGGWTDANATFQINTLPTVDSLKINGTEILFTDVPTVADTGGLIEWIFADDDSDTQRAYSLRVSQISGEDVYDIVNTGNVFSSSQSVALPDLPQGGEIEVRLRVRDGVEFGEEVSGRFTVNARPETQDVRIDDLINPGDVASTTPVISWTFFDRTPGDIQRAFRIQVATDDAFSSLIWDTGEVTSAADSVIYGSTGSPVVAPVALAHGAYYFFRVSLSDGTSFSDYTNGFFAINTAPNSPTLLTPSAGAYSGNITVSWMPASPLDADGDTVLYTIEMTSRRSSNQGWEYLAGPFSSSTTTYILDTSAIKAGIDYGVRVIANDGFADSDPTLGTSPLNTSGLGFTILNHAPSTPIFISPEIDTIASGTLRIEWLEASPVDVDGDSAFYILEMTRDASVGSPTYENIGVFNEGATKSLLDISELPDGATYKLRITAQDDKGAIGTTNYSPTFSILNSTAITDFETLGDVKYLGTSDGRIFRAVETIWDVDVDFVAHGEKRMPWLNVFVAGGPTVAMQNGKLLIHSPAGSSYILRVAPPIEAKQK